MRLTQPFNINQAPAISLCQFQEWKRMLMFAGTQGGIMLQSRQSWSGNNSLIQCQKKKPQIKKCDTASKTFKGIF